MFDLNKPYCFYFNEICRIPHGSGNEKGIADYLENFARERDLRCVRDQYDNVVIYKDASEGYEKAGPLILQGHMDMVCEANKDTVFDFLNEPLQLRTEGEWLMASGTTLGADDGVAVAYMLAILDDDDLPHPPLECCFTVQEEVGLVGALKLDGSLFRSKRMICLDHGGETDTCVSTSGGRRVETTFRGTLIGNERNSYRLLVSGLKGGHSGSLINDNRANANKLAVRIIKELLNCGVDLSITAIDGGSKENAIPRECEIFFNTDDERLDDLLDEAKAKLTNEFIAAEKNISVTLEKTARAGRCFDQKTGQDIIRFLFLAPNGFKEKSPLIEGLTVTSLNLGVIKTHEDTVSIMHSVRSVFASAKDELSDEIRTLAEMCDAHVEYMADYPGWNFKEDSKLRVLLADALMKVSGKELRTSAVHGGNECGVFSAFGVEDIISFGPIMEDIHTPKERLNLPSFDRCYEIILDVLKNCK